MEHSKLYQSGLDVIKEDKSQFVARCRTKEQAAFIVKACNAYDTLKAKVAELEQHRHGHLPSCGGADPSRHECDCGYLQGYAYRDLKARSELLDEAIITLKGVQPIIEHKDCKKVDKVLKKASELL